MEVELNISPSKWATVAFTKMTKLEALRLRKLWGEEINCLGRLNRLQFNVEPKFRMDKKVQRRKRWYSPDASTEKHWCWNQTWCMVIYYCGWTHGGQRWNKRTLIIGWSCCAKGYLSGNSASYENYTNNIGDPLEIRARMAGFKQENLLSCKCLDNLDISEYVGERISSMFVDFRVKITVKNYRLTVIPITCSAKITDTDTG